MARGLPFFWSALLSLPFVGGGGYMILYANSNLFSNIQSNPFLFGVPLVIFGLFIFLIGTYIQFVTPSEPSLREGEELVDTRYPSQRVALSKIAISIPFLGGTAYLLFATVFPYVYPTVTLLIGLYFLSSGLKTYWSNTLTTYYVTTKRVISEYRFIALRRKELPLEKVRAVEERKSIIETLVGLGNIRVASGGGGGSVQLKIRNVGSPTSFADELRDLL